MEDTKKIDLAKPDISDEEIQLTIRTLRSGCLSIGPMVDEFERKIANFCGVLHAIAVNSGTSALHLAIKSLDIGEGDEVITTPFSFVASTNCVLYERATPVFVDICPHTWNIDCSQIEQAITRRTKAILPVHIFGVCADMETIHDISLRHNLHVIEDSCEALGSTYKGRMSGSLADIGVFGFYPNKQITTGEGGMITTNSDLINQRCRSYRNQGRTNAAWLDHQHVGYNYRLSEIQASIGIGQMNRIDTFLCRRNDVVNRYRNNLRDCEQIHLQQIPSSCVPSWFSFVVKLSNDYSCDRRNQIIAYLRNNGIGCNTYFPALHLQRCYAKLPIKFPLTVCESIADRTIALPLHSQMSMSDVDHVCNWFTKSLRVC